MTARTAGIDLSADVKKTAVCLIDWEPERAWVSFDPGREDDDLVDLCRGERAVGIDCPFGWPRPFVAALKDHDARRPWLESAPSTQKDYRRLLAYRTTDREVEARLGRLPLSVSTDRIGKTAMRCAYLLAAIGGVDRSGLTGHVAEVYPAATLHAWGLPDTGLKKAKGAELRRTVLDRLVELVTPRLTFRAGAHDEAVRSDDSFDALVAALTARAVSLGKTHHPTSREQREVAEIEGWIHVPDGGPELRCDRSSRA